MATTPMRPVIRHLRTALLLRDGAGLSDGQLLEGYVRCREETALAALVHRHGPMVWGVCRRVLGNYHDAEDAFQATFLVLVRKAASLRAPALLANWLYAVARQTALKARAAAAKRGTRERQVTVMPEPAATATDLWNDVEPLLDQELTSMPDKYRVAIVLCDLEGKTRKEAARQLGVPEGTLAARVARGRVMLAKRLTQRGVVLSGSLLAVLLSQHAASACMPTSLVSSTIKAASLFAACSGVISNHVVALTKGVLTSMLMSKLKITVLGFLILAALGFGVNELTREILAADPAPAAAKPLLRGRDEGNLKETVLALERRIWEAHSKQDVEVFKNLLADDFVGVDMFGRSYNKAGQLDYVAKFRVVEYSMKNVRVVLLGATSALVNYQIDYKVRPTDGKKVESTSRRVTAAWAQRKGRWWYVYFEDRLVQEDRFVAPWPEQPFWRLSDKLRDLNEPIFEPKKN
jgi:RNA polymerase sigma factor (sigma-70 family)